eukprot:COSAG02_NODE_6030_length_3859_cov_2.431383_3_plen_82_part_00
MNSSQCSVDFEIIYILRSGRPAPGATQMTAAYREVLLVEYPAVRAALPGPPRRAARANSGRARRVAGVSVSVRAAGLSGAR